MSPTLGRPRLGAVMVRRGYVTPEQVDLCLRIQKSLKNPQRLGEILIRKGYAKEHQVRAALAEQGTSPNRATATITTPARQATRPKRLPLTNPAPPRRGLLWLIGGVATAGLCVALYVLALPPSKEKELLQSTRERSEPLPKTTHPGEKPQPPGPSKFSSPLQELLFTCNELLSQKKFGEAIRKLDEFPLRDASEPNAEQQVLGLRTEVKKKAAEFTEATAAAAEKLAEAGDLQKAADTLQPLADVEITELVGPAYARLRSAATKHLGKLRTAAAEQNTEEVAALRAQYASVKSSSQPKEDLARATVLIANEQWIEAIELLTSVASNKEIRAQALALRAHAHVNANQFVGALLDAELLVDEEPLPSPIVHSLARAVTRAPVDESVRRLYERALARDPNQPEVWLMLALLHIWRHDAVAASEIVERARQKKIQLDGPSRDAMSLFHKLKERGFPHGKPVYVDYIGPYEILTDANPKEARRLAKELEKIATEYAQLLPWSRNPHMRFRVMYFANPYDYNEYHRDLFGMTATAGGAGAYYFPAIKQLVVVQCEDFLAVVRHEAYHQFINYFVNDAPRWFNEGTAAFMEESVGGEPHLNERYRRDLHRSPRPLPPLRDLMHYDVGEWKNDLEYFHYCQASSFITWLRKEGHGKLLDEYLRFLALGHDINTVFDRTFGKADLETWEKEWKSAVTDPEFLK